MLQLAVRESSTSLMIFLAVIGIGLASALYMYFIVDKYSLLYYWDAVSHLVAARKLVDWGENPGLGQIGTVWMPLPHFLLLPFSMVKMLFTTGFAGTVLSLPCLALTSVYLFKIARRLKIQGNEILPLFLAAVPALLYATNPNILYLGITSMTEAPFMLFFVASAYYFQSWYQFGGKKKDLILCSVFLSFATLCRYESWFLPLFLLSVVSVFVAKNKSSNKQKVVAILISVLSLTSIIFWLAWNQYHYNDAFEFANAEYYSASWYAENRPFRDILFLQPANVLSIYGVTAIAMFGPFVLGAGAFGYYIFRKNSTYGKNLLLLFLAMPPLFTIASLLIGIGEMSYWFNSRFMVLLAPLIVLMAGIFLVSIWRRSTNRKFILAAVGMLFVYQFSIPAFSTAVGTTTVVTINDAIGGYTVKENLLARDTGEALKSIYDGTGKIMVLTGSGLEQRIMITSGLDLATFDEIIEHSTWKDSFKEPWNYDRWLVITNRPGSDALTTTKHWLDRERELLQHYSIVYENEYYKIMVLK